MRRLSIATTLVSLVLALGVQGTARASGTADLTVSVSPSASPTVATSPLTYTITVTNKGPDVAEHTRVTDTLPPDVMVLDVSGRGGYDASTGTASWYPGSVEAGTIVTRTVTIRPIHPSTLTDTASATTSSADPSSPNTKQVTTTVEAEPGVHYVSVRGDSGFAPPFHSVALGETVQWDVFGSVTDPPHDITDSHGLGLFDSGPLSPVSYFRYTFTFSAEIRTMDDPVSYPDNLGKLVIPVEVTPSSGTVNTTYTVTWATAPIPAGFAEDVQIKRPGDTRWEQWHHGTTLEGVAYVPDAGPGTYTFRDRIRKVATRAHSRFGPPVQITVS